jgi:hypothetical protein
MGATGQKHWYEHVPKSVIRTQGGKMNMPWKCKLIEPSPITSQTL